MTNRETEADRCAIVENIEGVTAETDDLSKALDHLSQMLEAVREARSVRSVSEAEAW
jgi:hypothetical protein